MAAKRRTRTDFEPSARPQATLDVEAEAVLDAVQAAGKLPYRHPTLIPQDVCDELKARGFTVIGRRDPV